MKLSQEKALRICWIPAWVGETKRPRVLPGGAGSEVVSRPWEVRPKPQECLPKALPQTQSQERSSGPTKSPLSLSEGEFFITEKCLLLHFLLSSWNKEVRGVSTVLDRIHSLLWPCGGLGLHPVLWGWLGSVLGTCAWVGRLIVELGGLGRLFQL